MKTRGGWRETPQEHKVAVTDVTQLSDQELERLILFYQDEIGQAGGQDIDSWSPPTGRRSNVRSPAETGSGHYATSLLRLTPSRHEWSSDERL